jgi:HlyD family secretion protein
MANQNIELAKRSLEQAARTVAVAQKNLDEATIVAPFDGTAVTVNVKEGDYIAAPGINSGTIIYLVDTTSLEISTEVDEIDIANIELNQKAIISLDALPNTDLEGDIKAISLIPVTKPQNSGVVVYEIKVGLKGTPPLEIKSGMSATVDIITEEKKDILLVPNKAVKKNSQGQSVVNVFSNKQYEERVVVLGITDGTQTEVISGLQVGDLVIRPVKETNSKLS